MSASDELQAAIYTRLTTFAPLVALVGTRVHDLPPSPVVAPYISFGPSDTVSDDAECITGREETLQIDVWSEALDGYRECKLICDQVKKALHDWNGELTVNALAFIRVQTVRVFRDPDGRTTHGVVTVQAMIEEA